MRRRGVLAVILLLVAGCAHRSGGADPLGPDADPTPGSKRAPARNDAHGVARTGDNDGADCLIAKFQESPSAVRTCTSQCERGDAESCTTIGAMYAQGHLIGARDSAKAQTFYARGCDGGDVRGCVSLGELTRDSDPTTALGAFERVCSAKKTDTSLRPEMSEACAFTATAYAEGRIAPKNAKRATEDFAKACKLGNIGACDRLDFKPKR